MDPLDMTVTFHFGGQLDYDGSSLNYNGGRVGMSIIERDKLSLPELRGHLADHVRITSEESVDLYWLFPGCCLSNGLRRLGSDKDCMTMSESITNSGVAELYVEIYKPEGNDVVLSPTKNPHQQEGTDDKESESEEGGTSYDDNEAAREEDDSDSEDSEYMQGWNIDLAENCSAMWNGKDAFEVDDKERKYIVDLEQRTCSCRYWQLSGIPCAHAITALHVSSKTPEDYIVDCYSIDHYNKTYEHCMLPMQELDQWPETEHHRPQPPAYVKMPGRPRKERRREPGEAKKATKLSRAGRSVNCGRCNRPGHNARTCTAVVSGANRMRRVMEKGKEVLESSGAQKAPNKSKTDALKKKKGKEILESRGAKKALIKRRSTQPAIVDMPSQGSCNDHTNKRKQPAITTTRSSPRKKEIVKRMKT